MGWARFVLGAICVGALGCAVDPSGIPAGNRDRTDGQVPSMDLGGLDGGLDLGPRPDASLDLGRDTGVPCVPIAEVCNGADDDCDGSLDEGVPVGMPCDGDTDGCADGRTACLGGSEVCQGDGAEQVGQACDGIDADVVAEGTYTCGDGVLSCPDDCVPTAEVCNRRDDDCDGAVDEDGICSDSADTCSPVLRGTSVYLFCVEHSDDGDPWNEARDECARGGYDLVRIDDEAERAFLEAHTAGSPSWWVGARTDRSDGAGRRDTSTWSWRPSGASVAASLWEGGEPSGDGSCAELVVSFGNRLNDLPCDRHRAYICEGTVAP